jgi:hypothetical protein
MAAILDPKKKEVQEIEVGGMRFLRPLAAYEEQIKRGMKILCRK